MAAWIFLDEKITQMMQVSARLSAGLEDITKELEQVGNTAQIRKELKGLTRSAVKTEKKLRVLFYQMGG